jgi:adenylate kinase family enzyme
MALHRGGWVGDGMRRVAVVGTTGSGKTTFARRLAARLGVTHVELDALHWEPGWTPAARDVFWARVAAALAGDSWVTDGNYSEVRPLIWARADTLVWLDLPYPVVLARLLRRTLSRIGRREHLWGTNYETLRGTFFSADSLFLWQLKTHWSRRRRYEAEARRSEHAHLRVIRLRSPGAARRWLGAVRPRMPAQDAPGVVAGESGPAG